MPVPWGALAIGAGSALGGSMAGKGGGGDPSVEYIQSPEQMQTYRTLLPFLQQIYGGVPGPQRAAPAGEPGLPQLALGQTYQGDLWTGAEDRYPGFNAGEYLTLYPDVASSAFGRDPKYAYQHYSRHGFGEGRYPTFEAAGYGREGAEPAQPPPSPTGVGPAEGGFGTTWPIPPIDPLIPQRGWLGSLDPSITAGVLEPYRLASQQLTESLGYSAGSPMAGPSGALGGAQAEFWNRAAPQIGQQAWGYMGPAQNALWSAQLQGSQFPYTALPSLLGGTYSTPLVTPDQGFNTQAALGGALAGGLGAAGLYDRYAQPSPPTTNIYNQPYGGSTYQNPNTLQFWGSDVYE